MLCGLNPSIQHSLRIGLVHLLIRRLRLSDDSQPLVLTIKEAKEALARKYDVSPDAIDITIRG
jgi:hypothetical protein